MAQVRSACVAGQFYPLKKEALFSFISQYINPENCTRHLKGVILPHAGYIYSGVTAALTMAGVRVPDTVLLLGPNHTGLGTPFSLMTEGMWRMPFGDIEIAEEYAKELLDASTLISEDMKAHVREHSLEVELPFLYYINQNVKIIPLTVSAHNLNQCRDVGIAIANWIKGKDVLIVVSSDMTHYEPHEVAKKKDRQAIDAILDLDEKKLADVVRSERLSMCGFLPVYIALIAAKELGSTTSQLVDYRTSGDVSKDYDQVVGYAGIVIE